jgi:hypothetical protein
MFNRRFSIVDLFLRSGDPPQIENVTSTASLNPWRSEILGASKCVPGGIRTPNLLIRSQMLYPVELQTQESPLKKVTMLQ